MNALGWFAEIAWKATFVMTSAFVAARALRRGPAAMRHFVWTTAFAALLALPLAVGMAPKWPTTVAGAGATAVAGVGGQRSGAGETAAVRATRPHTARQIPYEFLYGLGALLVLARLAIGIGRTRKMVRAARPAADAGAMVDELRRVLRIRREVRTLENAEAGVPMTWGIVRPVVLLPETARQWPSPRLKAVLLHELIHVQRHDLLAQTLAQSACCLYWFHPLVWLAARELRKEREAACDDAVLNRGLKPADYAAHLMELARSMAGRASLADAPAMAEASDLESRVRALLDRGRNRAPLSRRAALTVVALACALVLPVATLTTHAQSGRGALAGIVNDPSGARVPGCTVVAKNLDGTNQETTRVNPAGEYAFAAIPPGRYAIEVRAPGFKIAKAEGVVTAGAAARVDVNLEVGEISESVKVTGTRSSPPAARSMSQAGTPQRIPIGGNVQPAKLLVKHDPEYPADLKAQGVTGQVLIRMIISKTGEPLNAQVVNTDVNPGLAQAALDAVKQWRYAPVLLNGQPVEVVTTVTVAFELN